MILPTSYSLEWIRSIQKKTKTDPGLVEKVVWALTLLEQLQCSGLDFIFKGGTSLILLLQEPRRLSIDIDIIVQPQNREDLPAIVKSIEERGIFARVEAQVRSSNKTIPKAHYKFFYRSVLFAKEEPLLLDVLFEENPYTCLEMLPICSSFVQCDENAIRVKVPSVNCILGDKLTAFAPCTTGILYNCGKELEIIKQLLDIAILFDRMDDLETVQENYATIVRQELDYRGQAHTIEQVMLDSFEAALTLSLRGQINPEQYAQLEAGVKKVQPFIFSQSFHLETAILCAAKAAYLVTLLLCRQKVAERYRGAETVSSILIDHPKFNKLNRLKKTNPEAFFYWYQAVALQCE